MTQRLEVFFFQYDAKNWTFLVFQYDSKNWTFFKMLKELNLSSIWITFLHDSNWTLFLINTTQRVEFFHKKWLKALNTFLNLTERVEPFFALDSKNWTFFFNNMTQRIEPSVYESKIEFWKKERKSSSQKMTQRIELFRNMTHRIEFFKRKRLTELNPPFFSTWLTVLNPSFQHDLCQKKSQRVELFFFWSKELFPFFFNLTRRIEPFFQHDSTNWTFFLNMTHRIEATAWHVSAPPFCCAPCFANGWWSGDSAGTYSRNVGTTAIWGRRPSFRRLACGCSLQVAEPHQQTEKAVVSFGCCLQVVAARDLREVRHAHRWDLETCVTSACRDMRCDCCVCTSSRTKCRVH